MPPAPKGKAFRRLTSSKEHVHLSLWDVAGRYYHIHATQSALRDIHGPEGASREALARIRKIASLEEDLAPDNSPVFWRKNRQAIFDTAAELGQIILKRLAMVLMAKKMIEEGRPAELGEQVLLLESAGNPEAGVEVESQGPEVEVRLSVYLTDTLASVADGPIP